MNKYRATIKVLQTEERFSHADVTVWIRTEKNEKKFTEYLTNEVENA